MPRMIDADRLLASIEAYIASYDNIISGTHTTPVINSLIAISNAIKNSIVEGGESGKPGL